MHSVNAYAHWEWSFWSVWPIMHVLIGYKWPLGFFLVSLGLKTVFLLLQKLAENLWVVRVTSKILGPSVCGYPCMKARSFLGRTLHFIHHLLMKRILEDWSKYCSMCWSWVVGCPRNRIIRKAASYHWRLLEKFGPWLGSSYLGHLYLGSLSFMGCCSQASLRATARKRTS